MSTTIDQRVVEMRFDNKHFESNVSTTMSTLDRLKQALNLTGAAKGLENVGTAAKGINLGGLGSAVDTVQAKFSALQVAGITALANITNSAVNTGKRMISALTIDPIKTGFAEYETQINAVQTILANTKSKGTTIDDVNGALDELNTYADKTIYNFTEMTRNIGTFTAAGVDLDKSVTSIKGIANLAAVSGSTSQQASTAMYQLSQALAAGKVQLMDWNSVVNAGMGGQVFQDALKRTATHMGTNVDAMIEKYGSFRESLTKGEWLTAEVLTETLTQLSGAYTEADLIAQGYTEAQAKEITELADTAVQAATKVKTFTQLWDTLKEAAQSGWTQSWEIIVGDFEEAKELLTKVSDTIGGMIGASSEARNNLLQGWKDAGGRDKLIEGLTNAFNGLLNIVKPVKEAFRDIFPPMTVDNLLNFTNNFVKLTEKFRDFGTKYSDQIKRSFKGLFSILDIGKKIFTAFGKSISDLLGSSEITSLGDFIMNSLASIGDFFTNLNESFDANSLSGIFSGVASGISSALGASVDILKGFGSALSVVGDFIVDVASKIWQGVKVAFGWIAENFSAGDIFAGLAGGGIFVLAKKLIGFVDGIKEAFEGLFGGGDGAGSIKEKFCELLDGVGESIQSFSTGIKVGSFVAIAAAIAILTSAFGKISELDAEDIAKSLITMGLALGIMMKAINSMPTSTKFGSGFRNLFKSGFTNFSQSTSLIKSGIALIMLAKSIDILASAMVKLSDLSWGEIAKGLIGVGGGIALLCGGLKVLNGTKISIGTSIAMLALAKACEILGDAMAKFVGFSWEEIGRGLVAMGGALGELVIALGALSKIGGFSSLLGSVSVSIVVNSLSELADALQKFGAMSWGEIARGLVSMGIALGEVAGITGALGKLAGFSSMFASGAIFITIQGLLELASAFKEFGSMSWGEIARGFVGMGAALGEVAGITGILGKLAGFSSIFASGAILIAVQGLVELAQAFKEFGSMPWGEIGRGLVAMGGALAEVAGVTGALGLLAGFSGILGGAAIWTAIQGLNDLAIAFKNFGSMSWDEIGRGLVAMGSALGEVAIVTGALGALAGLPALLGGGAIVLAVQGLGELADALKKFGDMSWDEVKAGLAAMGAALGEVALGSLLNILSGFGASAISEMAEPLGVLADSVRKWTGVSVPADLSTSLKSLATGVGAFTFGGMGAGALAEAAPAVGVMADSIRKWSGVTVPEGLGTTLSSLAEGVKSFTFGGFGAGTLAEAAPGVSAMADSVKKWSDVTVPENIGETLESLGAGVKAFTFGGFGANSLNEAAPGVSAMADSVKKWSDVVVPDNLGTNLSSLASGVKSFTFGGMGAGTLAEAAPGVSAMADSVKKWSGVTVPDELADNLGSLASGVKSFTFGGSGAEALSTAATGVGVMADSIVKWSGVTIPNDLVDNLSSLASGVKSFTFGGMGADALSIAATGVGSMATAVGKWMGVTVAEDLGTNLSSLASGVKSFAFGGMGAGTLSDAAPGVSIMADSVKKWTSVIVPENLGATLSELGSGVKSFTFGGSGASSLTEAAPAVGTMADSVKKWSDVTVPENLGTNLSMLASGVKAFTFGGSGAETLSTAAASVGIMAESVKKWTGVVIPDDLTDNLASLASGVKKFTFGGSGAETLSTAATGVGAMADSVKKWSGVTIPEELVSNLGTLASGVKKFTFGGSGAETLSTAATGVGAMANAIKKWTGVTIPEGLANNLGSLATSVSKFSGVGNIDAVAIGIGNFADKTSKLSKIDYSAISGGLTSFADAITKVSSKSASLSGVGASIANELVTPIKKASDDLKNVGSDIIKSIATGIQSGTSSATSACTNVMTSIVKIITVKASTFTKTGNDLMAKLAKGIQNGSTKVSKASKSTAGKAVTGAKDKYGAMVSAGTYLGDGLVAGIKSKMEAAYNAGYALGQAAVQGEKDGQRSASPSKATIQAGKWLGEGLIIGMQRIGKSVYRSGADMGKVATKSISSGISKLSTLLDSTVDVQPTIKPVLDLSDIKSGVGAIGSMLDINPSVGVMSNVGTISSMMNRRGQNGVENEVALAINKLRKELGNVGNTTYQVNGITYDDGSNVSNAVHDLIRAARIERRV